MKNIFWAQLILICLLTLGCGDSATIWATEVISPDHRWVASARTEQFGGPGTSGLQTTLHLKQANGSRSIEILNLSNESAVPAGITSLDLKWVTPSQLIVTYKGNATIEFQAVKCGGIDISLQQK